MQYNQKAADVAAEVSKAVFGKPQTIRTIWMAMLAGGHVLIEDIPGVGKTTLALAFARALELNESRVQFTPDVLPSDIVGFTVFQKETGRLAYHPGSVMCNLFLGDEINRTSSRTQSALLEVMEEGTVTVDGPWALPVRRCCRSPSWTVLPCALSWATRTPRPRCRCWRAAASAPCWNRCTPWPTRPTCWPCKKRWQECLSMS